MTASNDFFTSTHQPKNHFGSGALHSNASSGGSFQGGPSTPLDAHDVEALRSIAGDVEQFTRQWIIRIRRVINRSAQLLERESLLAGAIAKLDQQKTEWSKRTAERELALRDQAKRLTEAWLEVEAERRKSMQGGRTASSKATVVPVVRPVLPAQTNASPVLPAAAMHAGVETPPINAESSVGEIPMPTSIQPASHEPTHADGNQGVTPSPSHLPVAATEPQAANLGGIPQSAPHIVPPLANRPILPNAVQSRPQDGSESDPASPNDAQSRQRIEEFKRMQRALRSNRNR
ncbi:hypothetical protein [Rhodopirellula sp. MGV]|uniref:hypothetical protein n=1 Tax=Rhodopirellula sp. MGV TaxID=2023130 RepID=UPI000B97334D|nr:hypothetical protein [Rhodopirellula sp. MGV]OYP28331.1 hypothetical protein CGZ80_26295 [Rhodopirellula sp. MGV]PNY38792.1 hypothetical protein C2E31_02500 [Rhodopirellula baltica]